MGSDETKKRILDAVLLLLGKEGGFDFTIRQVAQLSKVNVAAINYHFNSKENLFIEAMSLFGAKFRNRFSLLSVKSLSPEKRLQNFFRSFLNDLLLYPGFLNTQIMQIMKDLPLHKSAFFNMQNGRMALLDFFREVFPDENENMHSIRLFQLMSQSLLPVLYGNLTSEIYEIDLSNNVIKEKYIDMAVSASLSQSREDLCQE